MTEFTIVGFAALTFGVLLAFLKEHPSDLQAWGVRVVIAIGGAMVSADVPGHLGFEQAGVRATGALAVFFLLGMAFLQLGGTG